jgi:ribosomal protein S15
LHRHGCFPPVVSGESILARTAKILKKNAKDNHSRRGLLQMVADRKAHMKYLEKKNPKRYNALVKKLGLKK